MTHRSLGWTLFLALTSGCGGNSPAATNQPGNPPALTVLASLEVGERGGVERSDGVLRQGIPFAKAAVSDTARLAATLAGSDVPLAARFEPLARWDDGSVSWALLTLPLSIAAEGAQAIEVHRASAPVDVDYAPSPMQLPALALELEREGDTVRVPLDVDSDDDDAAPEADLEAKVWITPMTNGRSRIRFWLAQIDAADRWHRVRVVWPADGGVSGDVEHGAARDDSIAVAVVDGGAEQRGPIAVDTQDGEAMLTLFDGSIPHAADPGFHASWELVVERGADAVQLAKRVAAPLRASYADGYVAETLAAGELGDADAELDALISESMAGLRASQKSPENRGWRAYGAFRVAKHSRNLSYLGYYNQEYDPASTLLQLFFRNGDASAADFALQMARQYADASMSLSGGSYQHRAMEHVLVRAVSQPVADYLVALTGGDVSGKAAGLGMTTQIVAAEADADELGLEAGSAREHFLAQHIAYWGTDLSWQDFLQELPSGEGPMHDAINSDDDTFFERILDENKEVTMRDYALVYWAGTRVQQASPPPLDEVFAPFFARYGGDWEHFPLFFGCDVPVLQRRHSGGHTLLEMLVWGYLVSGDPVLRDFALRGVRYHTDSGLLPRGRDAVALQIEQGVPVKVRMLGWPLINLTAAATLTRGTPLHDKLEATAQALSHDIAAILPTAYDGSIQGGVASEALARYHRVFGDAEALATLDAVAGYWHDAYWDDEQSFFRYKLGGEDVGVGVGFLLSYGLGYQARATSNHDHAARIAQMIDVHSSVQNTAKPFAMMFRSTQRSLATLKH